ncbi:DUF5685 family protein [Streptomyces sp. NPDC050504]|uniref:DUF5685 family protein n=1 Tax=Streptomyces sp. NPDC050504 TaxID=3365618 RepID=UPI0037B86C88
MFGIIRPCRHRLEGELRDAWRAHLCGLCLTLRDVRGQAARAATTYDGLILSVLVEAQARGGEPGRRTAGPCPLRRMRPQTVALGDGARLAAAVSLSLASAKVQDHAADGDGLMRRAPVAAVARRVANGWDRAGARVGSGLGFDTAVLTEAAERQTAVEALTVLGGSPLVATEPTETASAAACAHTAVLAGRPENAEPLAEVGRLFGRVAHLVDAVDDLEKDRAAGAYNPLIATGTTLAEARRLCEDAAHGVRLALREVEFTDDRLVRVLLEDELDRAIERTFRAHNPYAQGQPVRCPGCERYVDNPCRNCRRCGRCCTCDNDFDPEMPSDPVSSSGGSGSDHGGSGGGWNGGGGSGSGGSGGSGWNGGGGGGGRGGGSGGGGGGGSKGDCCDCCDC